MIKQIFEKLAACFQKILCLLGFIAAPAPVSRLSGSEKLNAVTLAILRESSRCPVCIDIYKGRIYQCKDGHLICEMCHDQFLARYSIPKCPICVREISRFSPIRNRFAENFFREMPQPCSFCADYFMPNLIGNHETVCLIRPVKCRYSRLGCQWTGPFHLEEYHCRNCINMSVDEANLFSKLNQKDYFETIRFFLVSTNVKFKSYQSLEFMAFKKLWMIEIRIHENKGSLQPYHLSYKLALMHKIGWSKKAKFYITGSPHAVFEKRQSMHGFYFGFDKWETEYYGIKMARSEFEKLLDKKIIYFRFYMANM